MDGMAPGGQVFVGRSEEFTYRERPYNYSSNSPHCFRSTAAAAEVVEADRRLLIFSKFHLWRNVYYKDGSVFRL